MEQMSTRKCLLLLGSTGFLGSAIVDSFRSQRENDWDLIVSKSSPIEASLFFNFIDFDLKLERETKALNFINTSEVDLVVINCASSRNSKKKDLSQQSNFEFPKKVLESLTATVDSQINWIQIETFWQYSKNPTPDADYVHWKNQFKTLLKEFSNYRNLNVFNLTLPHLIGPFDDLDRFLPRVFTILLRNEKVGVNSPDEIFCLADVRDVAQYLIQVFRCTTTFQKSRTLLFPFFELTLQEIIEQFQLVSKSHSIVDFIETSKVSNPPMILTEQPPLLRSDEQLLRNLDATFTDIFKSLSGHYKIGTL